jgi:predicted RNase H-like nuclease
MQVIGLDGWKSRWVGVEVADGAFVSAAVYQSLAAARAATPGAAVFGVDVPIGLPGDAEERPADIAARKRLGKGSSVFRVYPEAVLATENYSEALVVAQRLCGRGISRQSHGLREKIFEAADAVGCDARFHEVHPEVSFHELAGCRLPPKASWAGMHRRWQALARVGIKIPADLGPGGEAGADDVLDAAAAAWSAWRIARGEGKTLPSMPPRDPRSGRLVAIWY